MFGAIQKDVQAFLLRMTATLDNVDNTLAEAQMLLAEARSELAAIRQVREALTGKR